ncbi:TMEM209 [Bugula neritina]|uniref:TMEM209 n=1 Tax=Bugula neritina TaxID=10212 RepID=A0A7J7K4S3_BUGNE|nr:TMEM209 [Bugula neritina]
MKRFVHNLNSSFELQNVEKVLKRKEANKENRNIKQRISVGLLFFLLICYDLYTKAICRWFSLSISLVWFAESILLTASAVYTIAESIAYVSSVLFPKYVDVTDREKTLLGIGDNEPGFRKSPTTTAQSTPVRNIKFSPSSYNQSAHLSPGHTSSSGVMTVRAGASLHLDDSHHSFASYTGSLTPSFYAKTPVGSFNGQLNSSADDSFPRLRLSPSRYLSPERTTSGMTSQKDLDSFLEKEAIKENKELLRQAEMNTANVSSFWNVNRRVLDYIPMLKNFKYQVAPRSSQQSSASSGQRL